MNQSETSLNKQNGFPIVQNSKILRLKLFPLYNKMKINCLGQGRDFSLRLTTTLTKLRTFWGRNSKIFCPNCPVCCHENSNRTLLCQDLQNPARMCPPGLLMALGPAWELKHQRCQLLWLGRNDQPGRNPCLTLLIHPKDIRNSFKAAHETEMGKVKPVPCSTMREKILPNKPKTPKNSAAELICNPNPKGCPSTQTASPRAATSSFHGYTQGSFYLEMCDSFSLKIQTQKLKLALNKLDTTLQEEFFW